MIKIYKSLGGFVEIASIEKGCWINVTCPTPHEIELIKSDFGVPEDIIQDVLDIDERSRLEYDDNWLLIILRIPIFSPGNGIPYYTVPLGVFITEDFTLTLCSTENEVLPNEQPSLYKDLKPQMITDVFNFVLKLFLRSSNLYLKYLKQINQQTAIIERELEKSIRNKELTRLLKMEKCLVYFITSLKSNEIVLVKLRNSSKRGISEINEDLLEDVITENKQAIEMAQIYSDIQSGLMDAFASVISNNLNDVMKQLTSISIILMIPTLISSMFGMNVPNYMEEKSWAFPLIVLISVLIAAIGVILFRKREWF